MVTRSVFSDFQFMVIVERSFENCESSSQKYAWVGAFEADAIIKALILLEINSTFYLFRASIKIVVGMIACYEKEENQKDIKPPIKLSAEVSIGYYTIVWRFGIWIRFKKLILFILVIVVSFRKLALWQFRLSWEFWRFQTQLKKKKKMNK